MAGQQAQQDEFTAAVAAKVREAVGRTQRHQQEVRRREGELRTRLGGIADDVARRMLAAAQAADGPLEAEPVRGQVAHTLRLRWRIRGSERTLEVVVNLPEMRLEYSWSAPNLGHQQHTVDTERLDEFDPQTLIFQLIEPDPWLTGEFPAPLPGATVVSR